VQERLQKILARAGFASRRGAEPIISEGRVTVNGETVRELGTKADLATDDVRVDGVRVRAPQSHVYLLLNKPRGVVTTRKDPEGRQTVMDLVPRLAGLFPVGRLDVTTEGLILLTNDGAFAERVSHPRYEVPRVYQAKVHGVPDEQALGLLRRGVRVEGETMSVDRVRVIEAETNAWLELTLHEGKHHEVRRMLEAVGHPVSKLRRVAVGPVTTRGLEPGQFRALTPAEIAALLRGEGRPEGARRPLRRRQPAAGRGRDVPGRSNRKKMAAGDDRSRRMQPAARWGSHGSVRRGQREKRRG
jgi:23S rRNA pseudouridine2605 synthase